MIKGLEIENAPFVHSFARSFEFRGQKIDRLALVLEHGLLSEREAREKNVPYSRRVPIRGVAKQLTDYDDVIFLSKRSEMVGSGRADVSLLFDDSLKVLSPKDMQDMNPNSRWLVPSIGEVYVKKRIPSDFIKAIIVSAEFDTDEIRNLTDTFLPKKEVIIFRA